MATSPVAFLGPEARHHPGRPEDLALPGTALFLEPLSRGFFDLLEISRGSSRKAPLLQSTFFQGSYSELIQMSD